MNTELKDRIQDEREGEVVEVLSSLKRVEAPANFERRVMSRIEAGAPARRWRGLYPALAFGLPAVLVLSIGAFVYFQLSQQKANEELVANPPQQQQRIDPPSSTGSDGQVAPLPAVEPDAVKATSPGSVQASTKGSAPKKQSGGGSYVTTLNQTRSPSPVNTSPSTGPEAVISASSLTVTDVLSLVGVTARYESGWLVTAVKPNSSAEHSGIRVADVILALDDKVLAGDTVFHGGGSVNSVRIRRGGQEIVVRLKQ
jgi:hypothetical protein